MQAKRHDAAGATRTCPHCHETILQSAIVCPACKHHVRFGEAATAATENALTAFRVEGSIRSPGNDAAWEYSMVLTIRNQRGEEIARRLIGVGAMAPGDARSFALSVEMAPTTSDKRTRH